MKGIIAGGLLSAGSCTDIGVEHEHETCELLDEDEVEVLRPGERCAGRVHEEEPEVSV